MIKTLGGYEVEIVNKRIRKSADGRQVLGTELELRRVVDGRHYHRFEAWGLTDEGGGKEIKAAIDAAPIVE